KPRSPRARRCGFPGSRRRGSAFSSRRAEARERCFRWFGQCSSPPRSARWLPAVRTRRSWKRKSSRWRALVAPSPPRRPRPAATGAGATMSITYFRGAEVAEAFVKGRPLVEVANYKVHASHRDGAGKAEVHLRDTDIIHVLHGKATLVTGGTVLEGQTIEPDE